MEEKKPRATNVRRQLVRKKDAGSEQAAANAMQAIKKTEEKPVTAGVAMDPTEGMDFEGSQKKYLTEAEVLRIQLNHLKLRMITRDKEIADLKIKLDEKELLILQMKMRDEMERIKANSAALKKRLEQSDAEDKVQKELNRADLMAIGERYGIKGKSFGYHPDTYELVTD